ncbi:hypothetical protein E2562_030482 [Oryza meyeriana var. granulata]|uniref:Uncharacterized protein n=1 Tax=Oryza meyeriana var. granulata TaxID=110450 RepID=A0A6G1CWS4_9ORYZ|nr:hypothetical protein E2562_030482 [Oryza meyeriana var. granulata]
MTNEVYEVRWPNDAPAANSAAEPVREREVRKVLVRIYGDGMELFFDREDEVRTFECMSRHGQGPRLLGRFPNGRIEEFIHTRIQPRIHAWQADGLPVVARSVDRKPRTGAIFVLKRACLEVGKVGKVIEASPRKFVSFLTLLVGYANLELG